MYAKQLSIPKATIILLLVLLFHFLTMLIMMRYNMSLFSDQQEKNITDILQDYPEYESPHRWASTKAAASSFGAPVLFTEHEIDHEQPAHMQDSSQEEETNETNDKQQKESDKENAQTSLAVQQVSQPEKVAPSLPTPKEPHSTPKKKVQKYKSPHELAQKAMSLADFTKGYLEQLKHEGTHQVNVVGDPNKVPTDEQIKYENYWAKLQWCIQNSLKIHRRKCENMQPIQTCVQLFFKIARSGKMQDLALARSSGIIAIDQFMLYAFEDAASSFPPLPSFIKEDPYPVLFTVDIYPYENGPMRLLSN